MEVITVSIRLLLVMFSLLAARGQKSNAAFLRISPARLQFYEYESLSFLCDGFDRPVRLKTMRDNEIFSSECANGSTLMSVNCTISRVLQPDSGEYWCEAEGGQKSSTVTIRITGGSVMLESPVFPVMEGETVTLRCRQKENLVNHAADFFKDGQKIQTDYSGEMTIDRVSKADEGLYKCDISAFGESPENRLVVMNNSPLYKEGGSVMLESPVFPVMEGETVTLRCRQKENLVNHAADFFKDGQKIQTDYSGEMTINRVSKADEGLYKCDISAFGESLENRLVVMNNSSLYKEERHQETQNILLIRTVFISVAVALMSLVVGLVHCGKIGNG